MVEKMEREKKMKSGLIALKATAIFAVTLMILWPPAVAVDGTDIDMSDSIVIDISTMKPISGATATLDGECGDGDVNFGDEVETETSNQDGILEDFVWSEREGCDPEDGGQLLLTIEADGYRKSEIDPLSAGFKWDDESAGWVRDLLRDPGLYKQIITSLAVFQTTFILYTSILFKTSPILVAGAMGKFGAATAFKKLAAGGTITKAASTGALKMGKFMAMALVGGPIGLKIAAAIAIVIAAYLIYDYFWGDDEIVEIEEWKGQIFALEPEPPDQVPETGELKVFSGGEEIPPEERISGELQGRTVTGEVIEMTKPQLNQWIMDQAYEELDWYDKTTKIVKIDEDGINCQIDPEYPYNPPLEIDDNRKIGGKHMLSRRVDDMMSHPGNTYMVTVERPGAYDEYEDKKLDFDVTMIRLDYRTEIDEETGLGAFEEFRLENLDFGVCISSHQSERLKGRLMDYGSDPVNTLGEGEIYTATDFYQDLRGEECGYISDLRTLRCAPGDYCLKDEDGNLQAADPDLKLIDEEDVSLVTGDIEDASSDEDGDKCGIDIGGKKGIEPDEDGECPPEDNENHTLYHEETGLCFKEEAQLYCPSDYNCGNPEAGICLEDVEDDIEVGYCVVTERGMEEMPVCDENIETVTRLEDLLYLERAPRGHMCVEHGNYRDEEKGKACPMGTIYYNGECMANTLEE